jgi:hypothetical protein
LNKKKLRYLENVDKFNKNTNKITKYVRKQDRSTFTQAVVKYPQAGKINQRCPFRRVSECK